MWIMADLFIKTPTNKGLLHGHFIERVWTVLPAIYLTVIAIPSLILLYRLEANSQASLTIKVVGHQWYWRYEYSDFWASNSQQRVRFDAYILPSQEASRGAFRLLETDNRPVLPFLTSIRALIRRADVLHAWAVPSLGVKLDATPGRLNQTIFLRSRPGIAYGQCSEICGANHRFIPIVVEFVRIRTFLNWVLESSKEL